MVPTEGQAKKTVGIHYSQNSKSSPSGTTSGIFSINVSIACSASAGGFQKTSFPFAVLTLEENLMAEKIKTALWTHNIVD